MSDQECTSYFDGHTLGLACSWRNQVKSLVKVIMKIVPVETRKQPRPHLVNSVGVGLIVNFGEQLELSGRQHDLRGWQRPGVQHGRLVAFLSHQVHLRRKEGLFWAFAGIEISLFICISVRINGNVCPKVTVR